jgi:dolichyl-phosphate-mannose-protein mannosyltransferase
VRARIGAFVRQPEAAVVLLAVWLIGLGLFFRVENFGFPDRFQFDEHHFVENARNYLHGRADQNDHPPLGKLFIALSIQKLGDNAVAWRLPSLVFGGLSLLLGSWAAHRLFRRPFAGLLAASFLACDGFMIAYSRAALLDGTLTAAGLASVLGATLPSSAAIAAAGGLAAGVAMSVKFSGLGALLPPLLALALRPEAPKTRWLRAATLGAIAVVTYCACYMLGLGIAGQASDLGAVISESRRLVEHHAVLTDMKNPATSSWPTWIVPTRPLLLGVAGQGGMVRGLTSLGNLALWWSACALALGFSGLVVWRGLSWLFSPAPSVTQTDTESLRFALERFAAAHGRAALLLLSGALGFLLPWVITHRDSYIYHFLPSYSLLLVLLAGFIAEALSARTKWVLGFLVLVTLVTGFYGPLWCYLPLSDAAFHQRLFVGSWR